MGPTDFIFLYLEQEKKVFNTNLALLKKHPGKKAVHDLRVAVKKIRAALELHFLISGKPMPEDLLKETEQLFAILGKQRDIEICLELIDVSEKDTSQEYPEQKNYFRSFLSMAKNRTSKAVKPFKKEEPEELILLLKKEIADTKQGELKIKLAGILNAHLVNCQIFFKKPHKLRQNLKQIYYWIKMIPGSLLSPVEYEKDLHDLLEDFGNWQNLTVFEIKIKHVRKDFLPKVFPEYEAAKMLEIAIKERKEKLMMEALGKTKSLLNKVK